VACKGSHARYHSGTDPGKIRLSHYVRTHIFPDDSADDGKGGSKKGKKDKKDKKGLGMGKRFPCPHFPLSIPHSFLALFALFALFVSLAFIIERLIFTNAPGHPGSPRQTKS
jgi:hypothetical protein